MHAGLFSYKFHDFFSTFLSSYYLMVQTSATVGYGDLSSVFETKMYALMITVLITSIMFFGFFLAKIKLILDTFTLSYFSIVMKEEEEMEDWLSIREKDAEKCDYQEKRTSHVFKKLMNTYRSYIVHNFASVQNSVFFSKLSWHFQHVITNNLMETFVKNFSYLTKTLGHITMKSLFSSMITRM